MNSWKGTVRPRASTRVRTGSSVIGSTRASTPIPDTTAACASVSRSPAASRSVRTRHIARSRSPRRNHVGRPAASSASITSHVSPRMP